MSAVITGAPEFTIKSTFSAEPAEPKHVESEKDQRGGKKKKKKKVSATELSKNNQSRKPTHLNRPNTLT